MTERAGRLEFLIYLIIRILTGVFLLCLSSKTNWNNESVINLFYICLILLVTFIPIVAATTRRLRDLNVNTVWIIINFIPIVNIVFNLLLLFLKSKKIDKKLDLKNNL